MVHTSIWQVFARIPSLPDQGAFMGVDPTDKEEAFTATFTACLNRGKIEEQWVNFDALGLLRQIDGVAAQG